MGYYHVVSRVVDRRLVFGEREKRQFVRLLARQCGFCGVRCLTYCVMGNHFHLLLEVPVDEGRRFEAEADDEAVLLRAAHIKSARWVEEARREWAALRERGEDGEVDRRRARLTRRMHDLSEFMRELKWRFSRWYNGVSGRRGTLWEERFRSVLLEGRGAAGTIEGEVGALRAIAAYIDLNPVRAGLVRRACDYRFSGWGAARRGVTDARQGLALVWGMPASARWREVSALHGAMMREHEAGRSPLLHKVRHFTDGCVVGSPAFIREAIESRRDRFSATRRRFGVRLPMTASLGGVYALRDLRTGLGDAAGERAGVRR